MGDETQAKYTGKLYMCVCMCVCVCVCVRARCVSCVCHVYMSCHVMYLFLRMYFLKIKCKSVGFIKLILFVN